MPTKNSLAETLVYREPKKPRNRRLQGRERSLDRESACPARSAIEGANFLHGSEVRRSIPQEVATTYEIGREKGGRQKGVQKQERQLPNQGQTGGARTSHSVRRGGSAEHGRGGGFGEDSGLRRWWATTTSRGGSGRKLASLFLSPQKLSGKIGCVALKDDDFRKILLKSFGPLKYH